MMKSMMKRLASCFLLFATLSAGSVHANDWPFWRGPEQTGASREKAVVTSWSQEGENLLWKVPIDGRTTPILIKDRLYAIAPVGQGLGLAERVLCLDANTGKTLWEQVFNPFDTDVVENRLGWTSVVGDPETGNIYAHTSGGEFVCLNGDGKRLWDVSMTEEFGRISGYGGRLHTPIIDEDRVIISFLSSSWGDQGKPLHRYVAFDKNSGEVVWWAAPGGAPYDTTYATPAVAVVNGVRMLVAPNADGNIYGLRARTGETLWSYKLSKRGLNTAAVVDGNYAYVTHSEENHGTTVMGSIVCIDASKTGDITESGTVWRVDGCEAGYASPAISNGRLYIVDNSADLYSFDAKTGKQNWRFKLGRVGKGSPTVTSDGIIYVGEQNGIFHIVKDEGDKCTSLDREEFTRPDHAIDEIYGSPIVTNGRVYFMTRYNTYCLGKKDTPKQTVSIPPMPAEKPQDGVGKLLIVPGEITVAPGEPVKFKTRVVEGKMPSEAVEWSVEGVKGQMTPDGTFTAGADLKFAAGTVTVKAGEVKATARLRVSPKLPFREDFDGFAVDAVPPGWLDAKNKCKVVERDGSKVYRKLADNPSPPFMRVRSYMTSPIAGGYTIEADILGTPKGERFKPDMGLVNTRYFLALMGGDQVLRFETWGAVPRIRHDVPFAWKTDTWYRMKCRVELADGKAKLLGKVWPREEKEPEKWSIEFTDPTPHSEGSPALFGYSPGTTTKSAGPEVYFDHVVVSKNE